MLNSLFDKNFKIAFLLIVILEIISFWCWQLPWLNLVIFPLILGVAFAISFKKIDYGLYLALAELFIGSKGYLFSLKLAGFALSIRMGLFLVIMLVWLIMIKKNRLAVFFRKQNSYLYDYLFLAMFCLIGLINGFIHQAYGDIYLDFNGWLFFGYLPVFFSAFYAPQFIKNCLNVFFAAVSFLSLKTIILLLVFAHQFNLPLEIIYRWIRNSGVGEITYVSGNFYRIFMQSQIYVLIGLLVIVTLILFSKNICLPKIKIRWLYVIAGLSSISILVSLSRSFWVGLSVSMIILLIFYARYIKPKFTVFLRLIASLILIISAEAVLLNIVTLNFSDNLLNSRLNDPFTEAAASSRMSQLAPLWQSIKNEPLLGSGFGQTVAYVSNDPRIREQSPDGEYTTYAFEWGYLDIWLKIGLLGLLSYFIILGKVFSDSMVIIKRRSSESWLVLGLVIGLISLGVTSTFSPYLNHPLGIGYVMIISAIIYRIKNYGTESKKISGELGNL